MNEKSLSALRVHNLKRKMITVNFLEMWRTIDATNQFIVINESGENEILKLEGFDFRGEINSYRIQKIAASWGLKLNKQNCLKFKKLGKRKPKKTSKEVMQAFQEISDDLKKLWEHKVGFAVKNIIKNENERLEKLGIVPPNDD